MDASPNIKDGGFLNPESVVGDFGVMPGMRIADFGCGAGHIGIITAQKIGKEGKLIALDIMEDKLDSFRARAKALGLENVEVKRANLEVPGNTGITENTQDMVLLINILFQSQKKPEIVREAKRVLKPGGSVVLIEWKKGSGAPSGQAGLGPPDDLRTDTNAMQGILAVEGFKFSRSFNVGQFHYGMIFKK